MRVMKVRFYQIHHVHQGAQRKRLGFFVLRGQTNVRETR